MQLYLKCFAQGPKSKTGRLAAAMFRESVSEWCACVHGTGNASDVIRSLLVLLGESRRERGTEGNGDEDDRNNEDEGSSDKVKLGFA